MWNCFNGYVFKIERSRGKGDWRLFGWGSFVEERVLGFVRGLEAWCGRVEGEKWGFLGNLEKIE